MGVAIFLGMALWAVLILVFRYGRQAHLRLWVTAKTGTRGTKAPLMGAFPLAIMLFWLIVWR